MAVTQVSAGEWFSSRAKMKFDSREAAEHYDKMFRREPPTETRELDQIPTERLGRIVAELDSEAERLTGQKSFAKAAAEFIARTPSYIANPQNGKAMEAALAARGKISPTDECTATMAEIQDVFNTLAERGVLQLKEGEAPPESAYDAADLYTMPMDQLERKVKGFE